MPYKFNTDHQPEAADFDENYSDPREARRVRDFWPAEQHREWRRRDLPAQPRVTFFQRLFGTANRDS